MTEALHVARQAGAISERSKAFDVLEPRLFDPFKASTLTKRFFGSYFVWRSFFKEFGLGVDVGVQKGGVRVRWRSKPTRRAIYYFRDVVSRALKA